VSTENKAGFESQNYFECAGDYQSVIESELLKLERNRFAERFFNHDHLLWADDPSEITNRLGWVHLPEEMLRVTDEIESFSESVRKKGFTDVVVLGMGGSSLSSEIFRNIFTPKDGFLRLTLLDTTDPDFILRTRNNLDLLRTLFVVSSKSGSTVETVSLMKYFYGELTKEIDSAGEHFVCITDSGSKLIDTAGKHGFTRVFVNDPNVGGRFSALSYFGLVPASLAGIDIRKILQSAASVLLELRNTVEGSCHQSPSFRLGTFLGVMTREGRDKLGFVFSEKLFPFGYWAEQLIAESLGKNGVGILPLLDEASADAPRPGEDRVYIVFSLRGDEDTDAVARRLWDGGVPFVQITVDSPEQVAAEFLRFEFAVALAGSIMGINPFDQPDVESAKNFARSFLELYGETGELESEKPDFSENGLVFSSNGNIESSEHLRELVSSKKRGYISIQAYVDPGEENSKELLSLRAQIEGISSVPVTLGFGPRFLHSTGQLHKGDAGEGFLIQVVSRNANDLRIPDDVDSPESAFSFGILKMAQATGDFRSLNEKEREVVRIGIPSEVAENIAKITRLFLP
jgi:glucose-6-phosphate isomerase